MTSFSPPFCLFGVGGFFFFPNCSHSLIFQVASGMRRASLWVPHLPRSSRFLPHCIFDTPRASQKEKMKHWSCERWTPAYFRKGETWVPEGYELHNQGTAWRKGEENLTNSPRPNLSGLRAPAPFGGWGISQVWLMTRITQVLSPILGPAQTQGTISPRERLRYLCIWDIDSSHQIRLENKQINTELGEEGRAKITNQEAILDYPDS